MPWLAQPWQAWRARPSRAPSWPAAAPSEPPRRASGAPPARRTRGQGRRRAGPTPSRRGRRQVHKYARRGWARRQGPGRAAAARRPPPPAGRPRVAPRDAFTGRAARVRVPDEALLAAAAAPLAGRLAHALARRARRRAVLGVAPARREVLGGVGRGRGAGRALLREQPDESEPQAHGYRATVLCGNCCFGGGEASSYSRSGRQLQAQELLEHTSAFP